MPADDPLDRPLGWWLKKADAQLDAAFDRSLHGRGVDRRRWQILASLAREPTQRSALVAALAPFDGAEVIEAVVGDLMNGGWLDEADGVLSLTEQGSREQAALVPLAGDVRRQVAEALPEDDYVTLVRLLEQLVTSLDHRAGSQ